MTQTKIEEVAVFDDIVWRMASRLHVGTSYLGVVRYVLSRLKGGRATFLKYPKFKRRYVVAAAIQAHAENRHTFDAVMACKSGEFKHRYFWDTVNKTVSIREGRCVYDTDGDGDCHRCAGKGGCAANGGPHRTDESAGPPDTI